jgi:hypothetical protein
MDQGLVTPQNMCRSRFAWHNKRLEAMPVWTSDGMMRGSFSAGVVLASHPRWRRGRRLRQHGSPMLLGPWGRL